MRIGEVARRSGVSVRALRYYEEQHLLAAERSSSGQRHYPESAIARVQLIQQFYAAGLPSRTIRELLPCVHSGRATAAMIEHMQAERDRIDRQARELAEARRRLEDMIASATAAAS